MKRNTEQVLITIFAIVISFYAVIMPFITSAALITFEDPIKSKDVMDLINSIVKQLIPLAAIGISIFFIIGGFKYVMASATGQDAKINEAKKFLINVAIYGGIVLGASVIVNAVILFAKGLSKV